MKRSLFIVCAVCLTMYPHPLRAEEQVTLKSGTRLVGRVSLAGQTVHVTIGESQLSFPLSEVDLIGPAGTESKQSPERLLMIALEARGQQGSSAGQIGLLAEAYRQAPADTRIAFWYAQSLADAGYGSAANGILQKHYAAIEQSFPGVINRLVEQIRERMALEYLPPRMRDRVDQLNKSIGATSLRSDRLPMFVRFRLVDSAGQAVERSAIRVSCNGSDERLEAFENGHYLFTFNGYRNNEDSVCKLTVHSPGLESKEFALQPSADQVANAGDLVVKRFSDQDKVPLTIIVAEHSGTSVEGATVVLRPEDRGDENASQTATTDADGRAMFKAFPMKYTYTVTAKGFKAEGGPVELKPDGAQVDEQRVELYPSISATVRFAWSTTPLQGDAATISNETTLQVGEGIPPMPYTPDTMPVLRPVQVKDKLLLQSGPPYFGGPMAPGMTTWVRQVPQELLQETPLEYFTGIDLKTIDELQNELQAVETDADRPRGPYPQLSFAVKEGEVYVGKLPGRDMRNGQPTLVSFKVFVEKLSTPDESD